MQVSHLYSTLRFEEAGWTGVGQGKAEQGRAGRQAYGCCEWVLNAIIVISSCGWVLCCWRFWGAVGLHMEAAACGSIKPWDVGLVCVTPTLDGDEWSQKVN